MSFRAPGTSQHARALSAQAASLLRRLIIGELPDKHTGRKSRNFKTFQFESLESRLVMHGSCDLGDGHSMEDGQDHSPGCGCGCCCGFHALDPIESTTDISGAPSGGELVLAEGLPVLSSNSGATAKLYLDFDGHFEAQWGSYSNITTPAFSLDSDTSTFSTAEINAMTEIWKRVSEDFAPFNIDVTTIDPGNFDSGVGMRVSIGGNGSWYGNAGGVAYVNTWTRSNIETVYVFSDNLAKNAKYIAEASSHEAGHGFGLRHQSRFVDGTETHEYHPGSGDWAPIMGLAYYKARTTWHDGPTTSETTYQDDMAMIARGANGFGYRTDDHGGIGSATTLAFTGNIASASGIIEMMSDQDAFSFSTSGGQVDLTLNVAEIGANLDAVIELRSLSGELIATAAPSNSYGANISANLAGGDYVLVVKSTGEYGSVGQYTVSVTTQETPQNSEPEIEVADGSTNINWGGTVNFGTAIAGSAAVEKTFVVSNTGSSPLNLNPIDPADLPAGFELVANFGQTTLAEGESTTFTLRMLTDTVGTLGGAFSFDNNDGDEGPFVLNLTGHITDSQSNIVQIQNDAVVVGNWEYRSSTSAYEGDLFRANAGDGSSTATFTFSGLTSGVYRVSGWWSGGGKLATNTPITISDGTNSITVRVNQKQGTADWRELLSEFELNGSTLTVTVSNDADGRVVADAFHIEKISDAVSTSPDIGVHDGSTEIGDGGTVDFGVTTVGSSFDKVITVVNHGNAQLTLTSLSGVTLPVGYTLVSDFAQLTLEAGESTTFTIRLTADALGTFGGTISILSNDGDESPFTLHLNGEVGDSQSPITQTLDDGVLIGNWKNLNSTSAYEGDLARANAGDGSSTATFTFSGLTSGVYRVSGWWSGGGKLATNTPITISDGTNSITVRVNQKQGVADWRELLSGFELNGSTLTVTVSNDADGRVVADAFRVERIGDLSATPQLGDESESSFFDVADDRQAAFANGRGNAGTVSWGFLKADHIHATGEWASHHQGETNPLDWWQDSDSSAGRSAHEHVFANSDWQFELDRVEIGFLDS